MVTGLQAPIVAEVVSPFAKVVQSPFAGKGFTPSVIARAIGILRSFGANASEYPFATLQGAYQTGAGPAAAAVNDPVGLELDAMGTVGPELVTNGDFSGGTTGWAAYGSAAISAGPGRLQVTVSGTSSGAQQDITTVVGKTYRVVCDFVDVVGLTGVRLSAFTSGLGTVLLDPPLNDISTTPRTGFFVALSTTTTILLQGYATGSFSCANISCVQVTGNHASQTTAINRPLLQRGLWNLLTYSQDFSNAVWTNTGSNITRSAALGAAPDGGNCDRWTVSNATDPTIYQSFSGTSATTKSGAFMVKGEGASIGKKVTIQIYNTGRNLTDLTLDGTWQTVTVPYTSVLTGVDSIALILNGTSSSPAQANLGVGDSVLVWRAGLFQGTLTAAQILAQGGIPLTTSAAGSNPTAGNFWAQFNGTSSMGLSSVPFQMADDFAVVACVNCTGLGTGGAFSIGDGLGTSELMTLGSLSGNAHFYMQSGGVGINIQSPSSISNQVAVITAQKIGTACTLRVNGVVVASATTTHTSAWVVSNIGLWYPANGMFTGAIYDLNVIKGTVTDAQLLTLEKAAAQRAGLVI